MKATPATPPLTAGLERIARETDRLIEAASGHRHAAETLQRAETPLLVLLESEARRLTLPNLATLVAAELANR